MKIYTKKGDLGKTSIGDGSEREKSDQLFHLLGTLDELNASLGVMHTSRNKKIKKLVIEIQEDLLKIGSYLINNKYRIDLKSKILWLEEQIDNLEEENPPLKNFILPGGSRYSASLHFSRAVSRRVERVFVDYYSLHSENLDQNLLKYFNRLSDLLFVMARYVNFKLGIKDLIFKFKK